MTSVDRWMLPEGVDELLPERAAIAERLRRDILDLFRTWGYQLVIPPLIEFTDSLLIGLGHDVDMQSFRLTDQISGKPMAVRADITPQTARIDAHSMKSKGVNRLCYAGSVLHTRPKALMASRCPIQVGAELYGDASAQADVEVVSLMLETLLTVSLSYSDLKKAQEQNPAAVPSGAKKAAGIQRLTLDLGHVAIYNTLSRTICDANPELDADGLSRIFDAIQRKSQHDLAALLPTLVSDKKLQQMIIGLTTLCGGRDVLEKAEISLGEFGPEIIQAIKQLRYVADVINARFKDVEIYFDLAELRGYEYHTGLVFAAYADGHGTALANGGRYDHIGEVFGAARPATGFNTDVKALIGLLTDSDGVDCSQTIAAPANDDIALWDKVRELRQAGETVIFMADNQTMKDDKTLALAKYAKRLIKTGDNWVVETI